METLLIALAALTPCFFKAIHGFSRGGQLFRSPWRIGPRLFLQLQHNRQTSLRRRLQEFDGCGPLNRAVVGQEMLVLFAVVVMEMHGGDEFAQGRETFFNANGSTRD